MTMMNVFDVIDKPEVKRAIDKAKELLRAALPDGSFAERETALLAITNEVCVERCWSLSCRQFLRAFPTRC